MYVSVCQEGCQGRVRNSVVSLSNCAWYPCVYMILYVM